MADHFRTPESYEYLIEIEKQILEQEVPRPGSVLLFFHKLLTWPSHQGTVAVKAGTQHPELPCISV